MKLGLYLTTAVLTGTAYLLSLYVTAELIETVRTPLLGEQSGGGSVAVLFLLLFLCVTIVMLVAFHTVKKQWLYRSLFSAAMFLGLFKLFEIVFPFEFSVAVAALFLFGLFAIPTVWTHNVIVLLAAAGIGPMFALSFTETAVLTILVILSFYDIIAVYVTKHMVTIAHEMIRHSATFALLIPERLHGFGASLSSVKPGSGFLIFGGGDLVLPMIYLSVIARESMNVASVGVLGALVGILGNHLAIVMMKKPIPALPLIALGAISGTMVGQTML